MAHVDRAALAARIQGFGNVNPPPLEEETGATIAKRAVGRLGDMVGEEVMLTVEDFREKGAVGAVKDAVADAGDILIDGVAGIFGWIRGDPPPEEENEAAEAATKALSNGPGGAAYGISQASPTGGINAVWVMPEEADPSALAQLAAQGGVVSQGLDPRVPKNIQPYQPTPGRNQPPPYSPHAQMAIPGGPTIAPYQPAPSGPGGRPPPFVPGPGGYQQPGFPQMGGFKPPGAQWGPGGYNPSSGLSGASGSSSAGGAGAKGLVERIAKGDVIPGPEVAKRLVSQCTATKTTGKQLGELICERTRRLYLGLDGGDPNDADASMSRLLALADALAQQGTDLTKDALKEIKGGVQEEFMSLRASAKHKDAAEPMLRRIGMVAGGAAPSATVDLLDGGGGGSSSADLLGNDPAPAKGGSASLLEDDLLGGGSSAPAPATQTSSDLLGGVSLDPLASSAAPASDPSGLGGLAGLSLDMPAPAAASPPAMTGAPGTMGGGASLPKEVKKDDDIFGFVGAELSKAGKK